MTGTEEEKEACAICGRENVELQAAGPAGDLICADCAAEMLVKIEDD